MAAQASALQLAANRANALHSTGPRTLEGRLTSSRNAQSHGLTTRAALLPGEDPLEYQQHQDGYLEHYQPSDPLAHQLVIELSDLQWRLRRVPSFEATLYALELHELKTNPELKPLIGGFVDSETHLLAIAFKRLVASKVLPNLLNQEARLTRRVWKIERQLDAPPSDRPIASRRGIQADPLLEFENHKIEPISTSLTHSQVENQKIEPISAQPVRPKIENRKNEAISAPPQPIRVGIKTGRNEPCPCNSGLKYKRCCLNRPGLG